MTERATRRQLLLGAGATLVAGAASARPSAGASELYGLIGKMTAVPGGRSRLVELLAEGTAAMPGCLRYDIAPDRSDDVTLWITEIWRSAEHHAASLELPEVQRAIAAARELIAGLERVAETRPLDRGEA